MSAIATCSYVFQHGSRAGTRCLEEATPNGYCPECTKNHPVRVAIGVKFCTNIFNSCSLSRNERFCMGVLDSSGNCDFCRNRTLPREWRPYPDTIKEIQDRIDKDNLDSDRVNMIRLRWPALPDHMWGTGMYDDSCTCCTCMNGIEQPVSLTMWSLSDIETAFGFPLDKGKMMVVADPGNANESEKPRIYYSFPYGEEDREIVFVMYPESGYVKEKKKERMIFAAADWIAIFGCPKY